MVSAFFSLYWELGILVHNNRKHVDYHATVEAMQKNSVFQVLEQILGEKLKIHTIKYLFDIEHVSRID